jgi:photosystem I subunit 11
MSVNKTDKSFDVVAPFKGDPFVGHLSTPITASNLTNTYLSLLPVYKAGLSPLLKGINVGFAHAYFLIGPFTKLGPLRNSEVANFIGLVSTISLIIILTTGLLIYGYVTFTEAAEKKATSQEPRLDILTKTGWKEFTSGFIVGGFGGASIAYLVIKAVTPDFFTF